MLRVVRRLREGELAIKRVYSREERRYDALSMYLLPAILRRAGIDGYAF